MDKCRPSRKHRCRPLLANYGVKWTRVGLPLPAPRQRGRVRLGLDNLRASPPSPSRLRFATAWEASSSLAQAETRTRAPFVRCFLGSLVTLTLALWPHISCAITLSRADRSEE